MSRSMRLFVCRAAANIPAGSPAPKKVRHSASDGRRNENTSHDCGSRRPVSAPDRMAANSRAFCRTGTLKMTARKKSVRNQFFAGVESVCPISIFAISSRDSVPWSDMVIPAPQGGQKMK